MPRRSREQVAQHMENLNNLLRKHLLLNHMEESLILAKIQRKYIGQRNLHILQLVMDANGIS
jgi:hypothetical protein